MVIKEYDRLRKDINKLATFLLDISPSGVPCGEGEGAVDVAIKYIKEAAYWVRKLEQERDELSQKFQHYAEHQSDWSKAAFVRIDKLKLDREELEEAIALLLDGLDSNYDERCGLTNKEWERRILEARHILSEKTK